MTPNTKKKRRSSLWALHARDRSREFEDQVADVLDQLDANKGLFQQLTVEFDGTIELVGFFENREPGVALDRSLIKRMAEYGLTLDCDFYALGRA